jgi:uncharacterized OB-fold protein
MDLLYDPPIDELTAPYWEAFERQRIALPRCSACGRFQWYPDAAGPDCADAEYEWVEVATTGTVHTMTRVDRAFLPDAGRSLPFTVALIDLDGVEGARLVAEVDDLAGVSIGGRVEARFVESNGRWRPTFGRAA